MNMYVNDLCIAGEKTEYMVNTIKTKYKLQAKGDRKLSYHIGADCFHNQDGVVVCQPRSILKS